MSSAPPSLGASSSSSFANRVCEAQYRSAVARLKQYRKAVEANNGEPPEGLQKPPKFLELVAARRRKSGGGTPTTAAAPSSSRTAVSRDVAKQGDNTKLPLATLATNSHNSTATTQSKPQKTVNFKAPPPSEPTAAATTQRLKTAVESSTSQPQQHQPSSSSRGNTTPHHHQDPQQQPSLRPSSSSSSPVAQPQQLQQPATAARHNDMANERLALKEGVTSLVDFNAVRDDDEQHQQQQQAHIHQPLRDEPLVLCRICGRKFAESRMEKHTETCEKQKERERAREKEEKRLKQQREMKKLEDKAKMFGVSVDELRRDEDRRAAEKKRMDETSAKAKQKVRSWRKEHQQLQASLKSSSSSGGNFDDQQQEPPADDRVQCRGCGRKFDSDVLERHETKCIERKR